MQTDGRMDWQTDMMKLIDVFHKFQYAPKKAEVPEIK